MFRRAWYWIREVAWVAVIAATLSGAGIVLAVTGASFPVIAAFAGAGITLAVLAQRQ